MSDFIKRPYPDNWPWSLPHQHPEGDTPPPFEGFNPDVPESGTVVSNLAQALREAKIAYNSVVSVPAVFSCDVEDGDIVIPLPCGDSCDVNCDELLKTLRDLGQIPDAIWVPAFRTSTDTQISTLSSVDPTTYDPPFYGVAYTGIKRVMVGPVVVHPRFKFHTGDKIYAGEDGDLTATANEHMVGVCLAPGSIFLSQYASVLREAMKDLYDEATQDAENNTIEKIEQEGLDGDNIKVTTDGATTERPLELHLGDIVNVKDFGAKGDGVTNDTNAFNAAIAHMQELGSNVCLFIPPGDYLVTTLPNVPCYGPGSVKYNNYLYSPFELLFKLNGAIQKDTNGRFKVDFTKMSEADLAALIKQLLPSAGGGLTTDEDGKLVVDFTQMSEEELKEMIESLLPDSSGLTTDEEGKLVIDFSQMAKEQLQDLISQIVQTGGGLNVDESGKIYVDFDNMPTDKFEAMLRSIRVPIWITGTKNFYVNPTTGSDELDDGRGESASKPFATIQACVDYVTENYNINSKIAAIRLAAGTYNEGGINLGDYSRTTGYIGIIPDGDPYSVIINDTTTHNTFIVEAGLWYIRRITINKTYPIIQDELPHFPHVVSVYTSGEVHLDGLDVHFIISGEAYTTNRCYPRCLGAYDGGILFIDATSNERNTFEVQKGNAASMDVLFAEDGGKIGFNGSNTSQAYCTIKGYGTFTRFAKATNGDIAVNSGPINNAIWEVPSDKTATGTRYMVSNRGYIGTGSKGENYFPGDENGTVETESYSVYK